MMVPLRGKRKGEKKGRGEGDWFVSGMGERVLGGKGACTNGP